MLGLTFEKLIVIAVFAALILGPERLPHYAGRLADLVRAIRSFTETAKARAVEQLGPDFEQTDWTKLDPRRYDPRRIIQEALVPDEEAPAPIAGEPDVTPTAPPAPPEFRRSSDGHLVRV